MDPKGLAFLGAGLGAGLALIGAGMGIGRLAASAMDGIARQPQAAGTIQTALYASRDYIKSLGKRHSEDDYRWVALDESLAHLESAKWMRQHVPADRIAMRFDNLIGMVDAVASGIGVGMLLCPLADKRPELVRLQEPMRQMDTQVWVLTHPDLKHVARIRALTDFLYERLSADSRLRHDFVASAR